MRIYKRFKGSIRERAKLLDDSMLREVRIIPEATGSIAGTLSAGSGVYQSENIHTGSSGQADLRFLDNSNLTVGPGSNVRLDKFVYDPDKGTRGVAIEASRGAFRFVTASQGKGSVSIKTPSGTLGIRG